MYEGHSIAVVVPAYNEEGYVGQTIDSIPAYVDRVYVIDDGSTDGTWAEITEHASGINETQPPEAPSIDAKVVPIRHEENRGVGGAIKTGYRRARTDDIDATAVVGGDDQMNLAELPRYLDPIVSGDADYVKGSRFLRRSDWADMPRFRFIGNVLLSYLTKIASGYWKTLDPQNGYTVISRQALEQASIDEMYEYYGYCNDLLVKLNVENLRVADVPRSSTYAYDDGWKSHIEYREYVPRVSMMLLRNFFYRLNRKYLFRDFHPLALFYYLGLALIGLGIAHVGSRVLGRRGRGLALITNGFVMLLFAAVLDVEDNQDLELQVGFERSPAGDVPRDGEPAGDRATEPAARANGGVDRG